MTKKKAAGRQAAKETIKEKRRRKAKVKPRADKAPRQSESPTSERNPGDSTDDRLDPQEANSIGLARGDLGLVCKTLKTGRIPLADEYREAIGELLYAVVIDGEAPIRERIRAAQGLIAADRLNVTTEQAQDTPSVPPTITVVNDDRGYWEYRHQLIRQQRELEEKAGGSDG